MKIKLWIDGDGAAFDETPASEAARILRDVANRMERGDSLDWSPLYDFNGNKCGEITISRSD